jgi:release factor glutamine methyltransferase
VPDNDPLIFYKVIAGIAQRALKKSGNLYCEINEDLSAETLSLIENGDFKAELRKDIHNKYRMIKATKL